MKRPGTVRSPGLSFFWLQTADCRLWTVPEAHIIKKYANRRLYDAASSRHVTLDDLRRLIVQGEKLKVIDDKTREDITRSVLLQIISEQEHLGRPILTIPVLETLIRFYG